MNILFVCKRRYTNKDLLTDKFGRLFHLPINLAALGAAVTVLAVDYRSSRSESIVANGVEFSSVPVSLLNPFRLPSQLRRWLHQGKPDVVIASGDSHLGFLARHLAHRAGAGFVYDVYDYYPAFTGNRLPGMTAMFRAATRNADLVLCASLPLLKRLGELNSRLMLVENGVDRTLFRPMSLQAARRSLRLPEQVPIVGYFGSITPSRGPLLIEACRALRNSIPSLHLLLAGPAFRVTFPDDWMIYLGELPQHSVPTLIAACNVVAVPYANDAFNSMTGACKIPEYLACERPIVATRVAGHELILAQYQTSLCSPDVEAMAAAIDRQIKSPVVATFPESMDWRYIGRSLFGALTGLRPRFQS